MASGKKNYFRHSFFARNDEFICGLIDEFGLSGYFYYFSLIEMCGEQSADELQENYKFHKRTLVHSLRLNTRKLNLFLGYLQDKFKISYTYTNNQYEIIFPNLSKYLGKYTNKIEPNSSNKRKEKKRKEKESKVNTKELLKNDINALFKKRGPLTIEATYILERVKPEHQNKWLETYDPDYLLEIFFDSFNYYKENLTQPKFEKKIWVSSINGWIKRDNKPVLKKVSQEELENKYDWLKS